ncbi:MAG: hypothetical protein DWP97_07155 [Calditrichaeota bacterium]|nr:MAG: hypothetical protein DWP97_07155 [Calditrichota bacterium]
MTVTKDKTNQKPSRWGLGIGLLYGGFVLFIISVVIFATFQDFTLVEDNYYQKSLAYQSRINSQQNAQTLSVKPSCIVDKTTKQILLSFPSDILSSDVTGTVLFFRASDSKHDKLVNLVFDENGSMAIPLDGFITGNWKVQLQWRSQDKDYYIEQLLTI